MPRYDTPEARQQAVRETAATAYRLGFAVLPIGHAKKPLVSTWAQYKETPPGIDKMAEWFRTSSPNGLAVICGQVSGNLEMLEFEGRAADLYWKMGDLIAASPDATADLWTRITADGYTERTPSGGIHIYYRVDGPVAGNTKLASRPATADELAAKPTEKTKVLIETRGQGGFSAIAPSGPECASDEHPGEWEPLTGSLATIPTITAAERDALHEAARTFHIEPAKPAPAAAPPARPRPERRPGDVSPMEDFNGRHTAADILTAAGWHTDGVVKGGRLMYTRPGKSARDGHSASLDPTTGRAYIFTTSTDLPSETALDPFDLYAWMNHGGDLRAAARQLRADGYGSRQPAPEPDGRFINRTTPTDGTGTDGVPATITDIDKKRKTKKLSKPGGLAQTDAGNGDNLAAKHGDKIRWCPDRQQWAIFTGKRWEWQADGALMIRLMRDVIDGYDNDDDDVWKWKRKSLSVGMLENGVKAAKMHREITAGAAEFDARPYELNCPNGIVDLRTGELMPHDPAKMHSRMTALEYHPDADRTQLNKFLADTFAGPNCEASITYLQRLAGHSLIGEVREHILPYLIGGGRNGKSVYIHSTRRALGSYADALTNGFFMKTGKVRDDEKADLQGIRYGVCSEVEEDDVFHEAETKTSVGGDAIKGRPLYGRFFTFQPTHSFWLMGNYWPKVESGGDSFWSRLKVIEFPNRIPEHLQDKDLEAKLSKDPALLAWMIEGAVAYLEHGLQEPEHITRATNTYAHDEDSLAQFIEEACITGEPAKTMSLRVKTDDLLAAYVAWGKANGVRVDITKAKLSRRLNREYGITTMPVLSVRHYIGIGLRSAESDSTETPPGLWMDR